MKNMYIMGTYFFDTSAIVKTLVPEPGSEKVKAIMDTSDPIFTSWVLIAEAMGVLKRLWIKNKFTDSQYNGKVNLLFSYVKEKRFRVLDVKVLNGEAQLQTYPYDTFDIRKRHPMLDVADALQFAVIKNSFLYNLAAESKTQLVTADESLKIAADAEGFPVIWVGPSV